ncbi:MAG TPA: DUF692 domain-containing protein [Chthoniobacterales bacterium]|nr:DUF692 domain-containing protein [Chthoniobacterales bacterium]
MSSSSLLRDRVGLGWRPELAAGIFAYRDRIDIVEVVADDYFDVPVSELSALRTLSAQLPVTLHGVTAGLASALPVEQSRLDGMARVVEHCQPEFWSEHLAFVRAGEIEIGHLAAPVRNWQTLEGTLRNLARATETIGSMPALENVATLIDPPGSEMGEADWLAALLEAEPRLELLLDLHNVYANSINFGFDPSAFLASIPLQRVRAIHIAGGKLLEPDPADPQQKEHLLDDHLHPVPDPVYDLLAEVAAASTQPLTVLLERDGEYPPMAELLAELESARVAIARGRQQQASALSL